MKSEIHEQIDPAGIASVSPGHGVRRLGAAGGASQAPTDATLWGSAALFMNRCAPPFFTAPLRRPLVALMTS
jgi:hypothetical protein